LSDSTLSEAFGVANAENVSSNAVAPPLLSSATPLKKSVTFPRLEASESSAGITLSLISQSIAGSPYLVWIFQSPSTASMFASFFDMSTGQIKTKRLTRGFANPPCAPEEKQQWLENNIASVLTQSRGPENTPAKPPKREPPCAPGALDITADTSMTMDDASTRELSRLRTELNASREQAQKDAEVAFNQGFAKGRLDGLLASQPEIQSLQGSLDIERVSVKEQVQRAFEQGQELGRSQARKEI